jgi:hypothetical protein
MILAKAPVYFSFFSIQLKLEAIEGCPFGYSGNNNRIAEGIRRYSRFRKMAKDAMTLVNQKSEIVNLIFKSSRWCQKMAKISPCPSCRNSIFLIQSKTCPGDGIMYGFFCSPS